MELIGEQVCMIPNQKYIDEWLAERNLSLAAGFAEELRKYAVLLRKNLV